MIKTNIKTLLFHKRLFCSFVLLLLILVSVISPLSAQTVTQGYGSDEQLQRGMLVAIKADDSSKVEALKNDSIDRLKGIVIQPNDSPVTLSSEGQKIFVASIGSYEVLVSDENGPIKLGDYISISSLAGIGMKSAESQAIVVGRALKQFDGTADTVASSEIGSQAVSGNIKFGRIPVAVSVSQNPNLKIPEKDKIPDFIQKISNNIAEKPVNSARIYMAMLVLLIAAVVAGITLYSGIRSSIISIGRNPLSKGLIIKGMLQVVLLSVIIFITGLFGVYLLLKL
jgi:hypothetical protein